MTTHPIRRGSALFVTILTVGLISFFLLRAANTVKARMDLQALTQAQQQAAYAAESVASMVEVELVNLAATNDLAGLASFGTRDIPLSDNNGDGDMTDPGEFERVWDGSRWFANCQVRWRVEPVATTNGTYFTVNPTDDPSLPPPPSQDVDGTSGDEDYAHNVDFYNFQVSTEAHYLANPSQPSATPWTDASERVATAQSMRVVQMRLNTLFKYALFYAAVGPEGDIEFHNGPAMSVAGSIHSNGSIYFGGDKNQGSYPGGSDLHPGDNGRVIVGENTDGRRASVVAIDGLYRTQKYPMYWAFRHGNLATLDPRHLPLPGEDVSALDSSFVSPVTMSGSDNSNAGTTNNYTINGEPMRHGDNDSRTPGGMEATWGPLVRDGVTRGATVIRTLSNIPELGGRPFERTRSVTIDRNQEVPLWVRDPTNGDFTLTVLPNKPPAAFYYDPFGDRPQIQDADSNDIYADRADDDFAFVATPPDAAHLTLTNRDPGDYAVAGVHIDNFDPADPITGRARQLYYAVDPDTIDFGDKVDRLGSGSYDFAHDGDGYDETANSTIPGLPGYITTRPTTWPVFAGGMPFYRQRDADGDNLFLPRGGETLLDVTDPIANPFDDLSSPTATGVDARRRSWYLAPSNDGHFDKRIYAASGTDVDPLLDRDASGDEQDGFRINDSHGVYYEFALTDGSVHDPGPGLVILERPQQLTGFLATAPAPPAGNALPLPADYGGDDPVYRQDLVNYLKSQYLVYYSHYLQSGELVFRDVTEMFFEHNLATATAADQLIASEEWVLYRRETGFMTWRFGMETDTPAIDRNDFRCNWLTLNMFMVCEFLRNTPMSAIDPGGSATEFLREEFNGLVWVGRTRRSETPAPTGGAVDMFTQAYPRDASDNPLLPHGFHPIWNPDWRRPLDPRRLDFTWNSNDHIPPSHLFATDSDPVIQLAQRQQMARVRSGNGPDCTFHSAVRLRNGSAIDWGGTYTPPGFSVPTRTRGLTVVSPNPVFLWGDYNTTMFSVAGYPAIGSDYIQLRNDIANSPAWSGDPDDVVSEDEYAGRPSGYELPPCAVFSDSVSVLSNNWSDSAQSASGGPTDASETWYQTSVVTSSVPTYLIDGGTNVLPSGGPHNLIRYSEDWSPGGSKAYFHIKGSVVVMGVAKYTIAEAGWSGSTRTAGIKYYDPPDRDIQFNTDLFSRPGQPPFTPFGVNVVRTVQTVTIDQ